VLARNEYFNAEKQNAGTAQIDLVELANTLTNLKPSHFLIKDFSHEQQCFAQGGSIDTFKTTRVVSAGSNML